MHIRSLVPGDEPTVAAFLAAHSDSSMFLRANLRDAGLVDEGRPRQASWCGAFEHDLLVGVAAHGWNGMLLLQAPRATADLARAAVARTRSRGRAVAGFAGPHAQVVEARAALDLAGRRATLDSRERLYALDLDRMSVPEPLRSGSLRVRPTRDDDVDECARWREDYCVETLGMTRDARVARVARTDVELLHARGDAFVLVAPDDTRLAYSAFNARLPDVVQVGGVWTPVASRGRGYARAMVAGSLLLAREAGARRAVLFTSESNVPAQRAYEALGFEHEGELGLVMLAL